MGLIALPLVRSLGRRGLGMTARVVFSHLLFSLAKMTAFSGPPAKNTRQNNASCHAEAICFPRAMNCFLKIPRGEANGGSI